MSNKRKPLPDGYKSWISAKQRCTNPSDKDYRWYGGRGIRMCERWLNSFSTFIADMGPRPSKKHSIDRIDSNGNYEPSNCRWGDQWEQARNRSNTKLEAHEPAQIKWLCESGYSQREVARFFEIDPSHVSRIVSGDQNTWRGGSSVLA